MKHNLILTSLIAAAAMFSGCGADTTSQQVAVESKPNPDVIAYTGHIQYEDPCIRGSFRNGCLRLYIDQSHPAGNLKYIDRPNRAEAAEFNNLGDGYFRLWYNSTDSIELTHQQRVRMLVELDEYGTTITRIYQVEPLHPNGEEN